MFSSIEEIEEKSKYKLIRYTTDDFFLVRTIPYSKIPKFIGRGNLLTILKALAKELNVELEDENYLGDFLTSILTNFHSEG
jgi:hypothetical protein